MWESSICMPLNSTAASSRVKSSGGKPVARDWRTRRHAARRSARRSERERGNIAVDRRLTHRKVLRQVRGAHTALALDEQQKAEQAVDAIDRVVGEKGNGSRRGYSLASRIELCSPDPLHREGYLHNAGLWLSGSTRLQHLPARPNDAIVMLLEPAPQGVVCGWIVINPPMLNRRHLFDRRTLAHCQRHVIRDPERSG